MLNRDQNIVELMRLSFSYSREARPVLNELSLSIKTGEFVCVIGHSGGGKSTLLNVLAGLLPTGTDCISLYGKPLAGPGTDRAVVFSSIIRFSPG